MVVKIVDVEDTPLSATVTASFSGGAMRAVPRAPGKLAVGIFELLIPDGTTSIRVQVTPHDPFWPAMQDVAVDLRARPPKIDCVGGQGPNSDLLSAHSRGPVDFNLEIPFVLGQVRDATHAMIAAAAQCNARQGPYASVSRDQQPLSFDTPPMPKSRFARDIVNPAGIESGLLNHTAETISFGGQLYFVERKTTPKIVAVVYPDWTPPKTLTEAATRPLPFHVFFSPYPNWQDDYPYGATYLDFVYRYLLQKYPMGSGMLYQNNAGLSRSVFVFPVSHREEVWVGDAANPAKLVRMLREIAHFIQRQQGSRWPLQEVGSISLSCYSAGVRPLAGVVQSGASAGPEFLSTMLKNIFIFDGVFAGDVGHETDTFCKTLAAWFRAPAGRSDRNLRVYTQRARWFDQLRANLDLPAVAPTVAGAREIETDRVTLAYLPMSLWLRINSAAYSDYWLVHLSFPSLLMEHAVTHSTF